MLTKDSARFESVSEHARFDSGVGTFRIGLLVLSNDYVIERDFINMRPSDDVAIFTSRLPNTPDCAVETLREMAPHISNTTSVLVPEGRLDVVAYGCTSGTAVLGFDEIQSRIQSARPGVACTTPLTASIDALDQFGAKRLVVLTPYVDDVNEEISRYLEERDKSVVTAVQALFWQSLRLAGYTGVVSGYGRLLRDDFEKTSIENLL